MPALRARFTRALLGQGGVSFARFTRLTWWKSISWLADWLARWLRQPTYVGVCTYFSVAVKIVKLAAVIYIYILLISAILMLLTPYMGPRPKMATSTAIILMLPSRLRTSSASSQRYCTGRTVLRYASVPPCDSVHS